MQIRRSSQAFNAARKGGARWVTQGTSCWLFVHYLSQATEVTSDTAPRGKIACTIEEKCRRLEAALFLAADGQSSRKLAKLAGLADATEARTLIRQLNRTLDEQGRSYRVEEVAGGYAMLTRSQFAPWLRKLSHIPGAVRLSQASLETLAVVAYRQPVLRANIEAIRGVGCSEVLKQLMELDLVRISGRSEELGRPYLYGTTRRFLQMFGLRSADRLPRIEWVNEIHSSLPTKELADFDLESKESTVKKSFSGTALLEENANNVDPSLLEEPTFVPSAIDDEDDDFDSDDEDVDVEDDDVEDDDVDDDDFDDEDDWDDDDEDDDDEEEEDDDEEDELEEEDAGWEEVDDEEDEELEDEEDDLDDDEDDDWDDDEEEDEDEWD